MNSKRIIRIRSRWYGACLLLVLASPGGAVLAQSQQRGPAAPAPRRPPAVASLKPVGDPLVARAGMRLQRPSRRVLALYFGWYGTPEKSGKWLHQDGVNLKTKSIASHAHYPVDGPYDSTDRAVLTRQLAQAKAAGIDTLVCNWLGRTDPTDKALKAILPLAASRGVTVCVLWDAIDGARTEGTALQDLSYLLTSFCKSPAYLREQERPVIFAGQAVSQALSVNDWAPVLEQTIARFPSGVRILADGDTQSDVLLWDGLWNGGPMAKMLERTPAVCADIQHQTYLPSILLARTVGRISVETVLPGLDDRRAAANAGTRPFGVIEREEGSLYRKLWEQTIQDAPDWVLINSFNQWHAGTEIEPSAVLGDTYLKWTAEFAARFRSTTKPASGAAR